MWILFEEMIVFGGNGGVNTGKANNNKKYNTLHGQYINTTFCSLSWVIRSNELTNHTHTVRTNYRKVRKKQKHKRYTCIMRSSSHTSSVCPGFIVAIQNKQTLAVKYVWLWIASHRNVETDVGSELRLYGVENVFVMYWMYKWYHFVTKEKPVRIKVVDAWKLVRVLDISRFLGEVRCRSERMELLTLT